jgi:hypothetical protein
MNTFFDTILWILAASLLGFGISAVFSGWLRLSRRVFLIPYIGLIGGFLVWFFRTNAIDLPGLLAENWIWGLVAGLLASILLVKNVRSQPNSRQTSGGELVFDLFWLGLAYGITDALFLNIMPVLAVWAGFSQAGVLDSWLAKIGAGILALLASLFVALAYHLGYREYRNRSVGLVLVGNAVITLAYLLSASPLGALISHTLMHIAATFQGPETTLQLPPHTKQFASTK